MTSKRLKHRGPLRPSRIAAAVGFATAAMSTQLAHAGAGFVPSVDKNNMPITIPTFYANSPAPFGIDPVSGALLLAPSGTPLRKFVDSLPGLGQAGMNNLANYIPVAVPDTTSYQAKTDPLTGAVITPAADYYEIGIIEYRQQMHSDLLEADGITPHATLLRGYVQIETPAQAAVSKHLPLYQIDGITPIAYPNVPAIYGLLAGTQMYAVDYPSYLGPAIAAQGATAASGFTDGRPVRVKYYNLLPNGGFDAVTGLRHGDLPVPVDRTYLGAGDGPLPAGCTPSIGGVPAIAKPAVLATPTTLAVPAVVPCEMFTENRATVHLHGGLTPWISDGTPHTWITPAGEQTSYPAGASQVNVPDMPDPGPGAMTLYWSNAQSARLMFYHDHAAGTTRVNVYMGEAAAYILTDAIEQKLVANGVIPADQIPLVIQDKTFVPQDIATQDARWDTVKWGAPGDLWFPHVYETNQDPVAFNGANNAGRWDYGPWFWPPMNPASLLGPLPTVSGVPEGYMDTPVVNGTAYPYMVVQPKAYRLRILSVPNDRMVNLSMFVADPAQIPIGRTAKTAVGLPDLTEVKMTAAVPSTSAGRLPDCTTPNSTRSVPTGASPGCWPSTWPTDGRDGGVPDPTMAGPDFIQIGNEGGLLPQPAIIPPTPNGYEYNRKNIVVLNTSSHGLWMGPAERADVIVDFSAYAGKTVILYNDAPAPVPAFDPRNDYYTGDVDQSVNGGAQPTVPGYGPNTRTIMRFDVLGPATLPAAVPAAPFNLAGLQTALPDAFSKSQDAPVIPQTAYSAAYGTTYNNTYARIQDLTVNYTPPGPNNATLTAITVQNGGGGAGFKPYTSAPAVVITGGGGAGATATAAINAAGAVTSITVTSPGSGYSTAPTVALVGGGGSGASATAVMNTTVAIPVKNVAIQELFDLDYGRMNSTLGYELPLTNFTTQTTIPLFYIDPVTEIVDANGGAQAKGDGLVQIWKVTHNGVDSHAVHFHLFNVQVINRVGWDGMIREIDPNEQGWKETVKMNPLEDVVLAVKAKVPFTPFGQPKSRRPYDVTRPIGSTLGFTNTGLGTPAVVNKVDDFGAEYVWHCHLLGHEENDMMRPIKLTGWELAAQAPVALAAAVTGAAGSYGVNLTWTPYSVNALNTAASSPYQYQVTRQAFVAATGTFGPATQVGPQAWSLVNGVAVATVGNLPAVNAVGAGAYNASSFADTVPVTGLAAGVYQYTLTALAAGNAAGNPGSSSTVQVGVGTTIAAQLPLAPTNPKAANTSPTSVTVTWTNNALTASNYLVERCAMTGTVCGAYSTLSAAVAANNVSGAVMTYVDTTATAGTLYTYRVTAQNALGSSASVTVTTTLAATGLTAPVQTAATYPGVAVGAGVTLHWTNPNALNTVSTFIVQRTPAPATAASVWTNVGTTANGTILAYNDLTVPALATGYVYQIVAQSGTGATAVLSLPSNQISVTYNPPGAVTTLAAKITPVVGSTTLDSVALSWNGGAGSSSYNVQYQNPGTTTWLPAASYITAGQTYTLNLTKNAAAYNFRVRANNATGSTAWTTLSVIVN